MSSGGLNECRSFFVPHEAAGADSISKVIFAPVHHDTATADGACNYSKPLEAGKRRDTTCLPAASYKLYGFAAGNLVRKQAPPFGPLLAESFPRACRPPLKPAPTQSRTLSVSSSADS